MSRVCSAHVIALEGKTAVKRSKQCRQVHEGDQEALAKSKDLRKHDRFTIPSGTRRARLRDAKVRHVPGVGCAASLLRFEDGDG